MPLPLPALALLLAPLLVTAPAVAAPAGPPPPQVIVQEVAVSRISDPLEALGTLQANEAVTITANVVDTVSAIHFDDGERVTAGQLLVQMTNAEEAALLDEAESQAAEAKRQYKRLEDLVRQGTAAVSLLDERRRESQTAQARLAAVRSRLQDRIITAPFAGTVGLRRISPGALVTPGQLITRLVDTSRMKLDFTVPSLYLSTLRPGTAVEARTPVFPGEVFTGTVSSVDSTIDPVTRSITVRALLPNTDGRLVPGLLLTTILQRAPRDALMVAEEAVVPKGDETFVMVVDAKATSPMAERRSVRLGARQAGRVEVLEGLAVGEFVVTHGTMKARPGAPVSILAIDDGSRSIAEILRGSAAGLSVKKSSADLADRPAARRAGQAR